MKVWNEEEGVLDTQVLATHEGRFGQPAGTTPVPASSAPIAAIPLATVRASPPPAPIQKVKGVVHIASDDKEDTMEASVFKRHKVATEATSHSSSARRAASFRDNPPSASSPRGPLALKGGDESVPELDPAPSPSPSTNPESLRERGYGKLHQRGSAGELGSQPW